MGGLGVFNQVNQSVHWSHKLLRTSWLVIISSFLPPLGARLSAPRPGQLVPAPLGRAAAPAPADAHAAGQDTSRGPVPAPR